MKIGKRLLLNLNKREIEALITALECQIQGQEEAKEAMTFDPTLDSLNDFQEVLSDTIVSVYHMREVLRRLKHATRKKN